MESVTDTSDSGWNGNEIDPRSQLSMLARVQNATEVEAWMPPTPFWHAPLLAAVIAGIALVSSGPGPGWAVGGAIVGGVALVIGFVDQLRRQRVRPRGLRKPLRVFGFYLFVSVVILVLLNLWQIVEWPSGLGPQVLAVGGMWLLTTVGFALGISVTNRLRDRWSASPR